MQFLLLGEEQGGHLYCHGRSGGTTLFDYHVTVPLLSLVGRRRPRPLHGRRSGVKPIHSFVLLVEFHQIPLADSNLTMCAFG